jgi:hypothetical protein
MKEKGKDYQKDRQSLKSKMEELIENPENKFQQDKLLIDNLEIKFGLGVSVAGFVAELAHITTKEGFDYLVEKLTNWVINHDNPNQRAERLITMDVKQVIVYAIALKFDTLTKNEQGQFILDMSIRARIEILLNECHPNLGSASNEKQFTPSQAFREGRVVGKKQMGESLVHAENEIKTLKSRLLDAEQTWVLADKYQSKPSYPRIGDDQEKSEELQWESKFDETSKKEGGDIENE